MAILEEILMGGSDIALEIGWIDQWHFYLSAILSHHSTSFRWEPISVYGPADPARSSELLVELKQKLSIAPTGLTTG
jgi:hypothetical protein